MTKVLFILTSLLVLQTAHSYILLTANIEDFQNVAKRLMQLPIRGQVSNIVRRAYDVFDEAYSRLSRSGSHRMRTDERDDNESDSNHAPDYADNMDFRRSNAKGDKSVKKGNRPKEGRAGESNEKLNKSNEKLDEQNQVLGVHNDGVVEPSEDQGELNEGRSESEKRAGDPKDYRRDYNPSANRGDTEFSTLGKSASVYLNKIKKIFENA